MAAYNQRLKEFVEFNKINPANLYKGIGASRMEYSSWIHLNKPISLNRIIALLELYPFLNSRWLLTGQGEMQEDFVPNLTINHDLEQQKSIEVNNVLVEQLTRRLKSLEEYNETLKDRIKDLDYIHKSKEQILLDQVNSLSEKINFLIKDNSQL